MEKRLISLLRRIHLAYSSKLVNKLILFNTILLTLVVVSLTVISYSATSAQLKKSAVDSTLSSLKLVNTELQGYLGDIGEVSLPQSSYDSLVLALTSPGDYDSQAYLEDYLSKMFYVRKDITAIYLYLISPKKYYYIRNMDNYGGVRIAYDAAVSSQPWYRSLLKEQGGFLQPLLGADTLSYLHGDTDLLASQRLYFRISDRKPLAAVTVLFDKSGITSIVNKIRTAKGEHILLLNGQNRPYYYDSAPLYRTLSRSGALRRFEQAGSSGSYPLKYAGQEYLMVFASAEGCKIAKLIPYGMVVSAASKLKNRSLAMGALFLCLSAVLVVLISRAITRPVMRLSQKIARLSEGDFETGPPLHGHDEIARADQEFDDMVRKINDLINERYRMKLVEKNAVLKALEAEINPHFLYNALQAISTKALKSGVPEIGDMVDALALSLRYCISGEETVKLREELSYIDHYLVLQKARFGSRMNLSVSAGEDVLGASLPKLSIQTLVENAVKHGVEKVGRNVHIRVCARREDDRVRISVQDDGPGIPGERLQEVRRSLNGRTGESSGSSIGLKNLDSRLKLIYGPSGGLFIRSGEGETEFYFYVPMEAR